MKVEEWMLLWTADRQCVKFTEINIELTSAGLFKKSGQWKWQKPCGRCSESIQHLWKPLHLRTNILHHEHEERPDRFSLTTIWKAFWKHLLHVWPRQTTRCSLTRDVTCVSLLKFARWIVMSQTHFSMGILVFLWLKLKIEIMRKCLLYLIRKLLKFISSPLLLRTAALFFKVLKSSLLSDLCMSNLEIWQHR